MDATIAQDSGKGEPAQPRVTVLMGLHNGAKWLLPQIESIHDQNFGQISLIISDDGSTDAGPEMAHLFLKTHPDMPLSVVPGPCKGFARNYQTLLLNAPTDADYTALSDQDDVWLPGKLRRAIAALHDVPADRPAFYCGRTTICTEDLKPLRRSPLFKRPPSFRNALVQSLGGGNTMVLNAAALKLVRRSVSETQSIVAHDWWLYQVISGSGGIAIYDNEPMMLYRQHPRNTFGANRGMRARASRLVGLLKGQLQSWNRTNLACLSPLADLTPENRDALENYRLATTGSMLSRLRHLWKSGVYRQSRIGTLALFIACAIGRL